MPRECTFPGVCSGNEVGMHGYWGLLARCYLLNCRRLSHGTTAVRHTTRHGAHMQHDAKGGRLLPAFGKYLGRAGKLGTRYNTQGSTNIESTILKRICQHLVISRVLASSVPTTSAADVATTAWPSRFQPNATTRANLCWPQHHMAL